MAQLVEIFSAGGENKIVTMSEVVPTGKAGLPAANAATASGTIAAQSEPDMKGWLLKWTNYLKGYQKRWFVLSKGVLSYYR